VEVGDVAVEELLALPGVTHATVRGPRAVLGCQDPDRALRALLHRWPAASGIEINSVGIDDVFVDLTTADETPT
jgi:ABC-2 type transport system ATP-binding protein